MTRSRNHPKALRVISSYCHGCPCSAYKTCSRNHPKALRVISREKLDQTSEGRTIDSRNHPKALRVISRSPINVYPYTKEVTSQSPEGSACHFKDLSGYACEAAETLSRNHPKALRVISRDGWKLDDSQAWEVAITRRLCVSFQVIEGGLQKWLSQESQSPEGSACHFKSSNLLYHDHSGRSQSPEGSACHFKYIDRVCPQCKRVLVAITRRLCVSFQVSIPTGIPK